MRKSQEIEEDITKWFEQLDLGLSIIPINDLLLEHREVIKQEAKQEVFNDLDNLTEENMEHNWVSEFEEPEKTLWDKGIINTTYGNCFSEEDMKEAIALYRKRMSCHMNSSEMVDDEQNIAEDCFGKEMLEEEE